MTNTELTKRIAEIKERWEQATPGPWYGSGGFIWVARKDGGLGDCLQWGYDNQFEEKDANFLAASWDDIRVLLEEVERKDKVLTSVMGRTITLTEVVPNDFRNRLFEIGEMIKELDSGN